VPSATPARPGQTPHDTGSVAVEAAIIIPIIILILFGIVEFALLLRDHVSLTAAARAGARTASALPRNASFADNAAAAVARAGTSMPMGNVQELWVYQADNAGYPSGEGGQFLSCVTQCVSYTYNQATRSFDRSGGNWPATTINACPSSANMTSVGVYIKARHNFATKIMGSGVTMGDHSVMRFEPIPSDRLGGGCG